MLNSYWSLRTDRVDRCRAQSTRYGGSLDLTRFTPSCPDRLWEASVFIRDLHPASRHTVCTKNTQRESEDVKLTTAHFTAAVSLTKIEPDLCGAFVWGKQSAFKYILRCLTSFAYVCLHVCVLFRLIHAKRCLIQFMQTNTHTHTHTRCTHLLLYHPLTWMFLYIFWVFSQGLWMVSIIICLMAASDR